MYWQSKTQEILNKSLRAREVARANILLLQMKNDYDVFITVFFHNEILVVQLEMPLLYYINPSALGLSIFILLSSIPKLRCYTIDAKKESCHREEELHYDYICNRQTNTSRSEESDVVHRNA